MITRSRLVACLAAASGLAQTFLPAHAAASRTTPAPDLEAEIAALLAAQPRWSASASFDANYGYRDNLLLSANGEERSTFARGIAELIVLRVPTGPFEYSFFLQGERTHYFQGESVDNQSRAWSQMEFGYWLGDLRLALPVTGYYNHQVFDVSDTDVERTIAELRVRGASVAPALRWRFLPSFWLEAQGTGERKRYEDGVNDGTVGEGAVRLGWIQSERLELRASAIRRWRNFDHRALHTAAGRERPGTELKVAEQEMQVRADVAWDAARRWRSTTRLSLRRYRDSGSGYFSYREQRVDHEVEWRDERWLVRLGGSANRIDFDVQTVGLGIRPPARLKDEFSAECRAERKLSRVWTLLAAYSWERSRSNDPLAAYRVNEGLLGLRWTWEN